ncbi:MAG: phosphoglycerate mutase family protein [Alphaproteobacteria bacterium]|nr:phosphoglycerate mutase family protein [Alphaproteobacteria bacterium]
MFFMRHGQTTFNEGLKHMGCDPQIHDAPLTGQGKKQVTLAAQRFGKKVEFILASPYTRALETATIAASILNVPIVVEPLVGEYRQYSCDYGSPVCDLEKAWPHLDFSKVDKGTWWLPFPEPYASLKQRVQSFREEWGYQDAADRTMVVSHWFFINAVTGAYIDNAEMVEERV